MQKRSRSIAEAMHDHGEVRHGLPRRPSLPSLMADCGPVLYAIRTKDGLVKIGWTANLAARRRHFGNDPKQILALIPGTRDDEKAVHRSLKAHVARGREYYYPTAEVLAWVNDIRDQLGVPDV